MPVVAPPGLRPSWVTCSITWSSQRLSLLELLELVTLDVGEKKSLEVRADTDNSDILNGLTAGQIAGVLIGTLGAVLLLVLLWHYVSVARERQNAEPLGVRVGVKRPRSNSLSPQPQSPQPRPNPLPPRPRPPRARKKRRTEKFRRYTAGDIVELSDHVSADIVEHSHEGPPIDTHPFAGHEPPPPLIPIIQGVAPAHPRHNLHARLPTHVLNADSHVPGPNVLNAWRQENDTHRYGEVTTPHHYQGRFLLEPDVPRTKVRRLRHVRGRTLYYETNPVTGRRRLVLKTLRDKELPRNETGVFLTPRHVSRSGTSSSRSAELKREADRTATNTIRPQAPSRPSFDRRSAAMAQQRARDRYPEARRTSDQRRHA